MNRLLFISVLVLGLAEFSYGLWIPAKAWLSQQLLQQAWSETLETRQTVKPWSWADTWPVLQLSYQNESYLVLNGMTGQAMAFGPGLAQNSSMPGDTGNTVISAHRDTHFEFLQNVSKGDKINIRDQRNIEYIYKIDEVRIADSRVSQIRLDTDDDRLTLITCYPFKTTLQDTHLRYIVSARKVS